MQVLVVVDPSQLFGHEQSKFQLRVDPLRRWYLVSAGHSKELPEGFGCGLWVTEVLR